MHLIICKCSSGLTPTGPNDRGEKQQGAMLLVEHPWWCNLFWFSILSLGPKKVWGLNATRLQRIVHLVIQRLWCLISLNHDQLLFQDIMFEAYKITQPKSQCIKWYWSLGCLMGKPFKTQVPLSGSEDEHPWSISRSIFRFQKGGKMWI